MKNIIGLIIFLACLILGATFYGLNTARVDLNYYFGTLNQVSVVLALFVAMILGVLIMLLVSLRFMISLHKEIRKLRKQKESFEIELKNLRTLPLRDE